MISPVQTAIATERPSIYAQLTVVSITLLALAVLWSVVDSRMLEGVSVWAKPAKFSMSFIVHFATLAIIVAHLSEERRRRLSVAFAGGVMAVAFLAEMAYLFFQAAQAEKSHFNFSTDFHSMMYAAMGVGAVLLILMPVVVAWTARRDPAIGRATRSGIWWGALVSLVLTLIVAGYLSSNGGHFVGVPSDTSRVLPVLGWSMEVGDLRPAHFLSLHALQFLPLIGLWVDRTGRSIAIVRAVAALYSFLILAVFRQALLGQPLISM